MYNYVIFYIYYYYQNLFYRLYNNKLLKIYYYVPFNGQSNLMENILLKVFFIFKNIKVIDISLKIN